MLLCAENVAVQPMTGATHCGPTKRSRCGHPPARCERRQHRRTLAAWWGSLRTPKRPLLEPKILSRHDPAGQSRRPEPAAYLGTIRDHTLCAVMNDLRVYERLARSTPHTPVTRENVFPRFTGGLSGSLSSVDYAVRVGDGSV